MRRSSPLFSTTRPLLSLSKLHARATLASKASPSPVFVSTASILARPDPRQDRFSDPRAVIPISCFSFFPSILYTASPETLRRFLNLTLKPKFPPHVFLFILIFTVFFLVGTAPTPRTTKTCSFSLQVPFRFAPRNTTSSIKLTPTNPPLYVREGFFYSVLEQLVGGAGGFLDDAHVVRHS